MEKHTHMATRTSRASGASGRVRGASVRYRSYESSHVFGPSHRPSHDRTHEANREATHHTSHRSQRGLRRGTWRETEPARSVHLASHSMHARHSLDVASTNVAACTYVVDPPSHFCVLHRPRSLAADAALCRARGRGLPAHGAVSIMLRIP